MLTGVFSLNSTSCSGLQYVCPNITRAFISRPGTQDSSARGTLIIRCARQRPQRSEKPQKEAGTLPSISSGGNGAVRDSFADTNPGHRAGATCATHTYDTRDARTSPTPFPDGLFLIIKGLKTI